MDVNIPITTLKSNQKGRMKNLFNWKTKQDVLRRIFREGQPVASVAQDFGVSDSTIRKWCNLPEIIFDPIQNVNGHNVPKFPFDPRQTQHYNNYHQQYPMYPPQFSQPRFGYQRQQVHPETPPLTPPTIHEPNESLDLSLATSKMKIKSTKNTFLQQKHNLSSEEIEKHLDELFFVNKNVTDNSDQDSANRASAIEAGEVFLAWMSTCPELGSNPNVEVLRRTLKRLKNYVSGEMKKKDGILELSRRRKK